MQHLGLTTNEWGIAIRHQTPRPEAMWSIFHPDEAAEPEGTFKWYVQGFRNGDDLVALLTSLADDGTEIRLL